MPQIENGRMTHEHDGPIGVFLIGMRFNRLHRPDQWIPVFTAMPKMLAELYRNQAAAARGEAQDLGFLGARTLMGGKGVTVVQYWRSVDDVYRYASAREHEHRPAWTAFNKRARKAPGAVGIWHETYVVERAESIYVGMPPVGLGKATSLVPVAHRGDRALQRLAAGATLSTRNSSSPVQVEG